MKINIKVTLVVLGMSLLIGCNRKIAPTISSALPAPAVSDCDSVLVEVIKVIHDTTNTGCKKDAILLDKMVLKLQDANKKYLILYNQYQDLQMRYNSAPKEPVNVFSGKIKNSFNISSTEVNKLKNSILAKDSAIAHLEGENASLVAKVRANGGSAIGDGNTITTKKTNWWWIFLAGMLTWFIVQNVLWRVVKIYIPILNFTS